MTTGYPIVDRLLEEGIKPHADEIGRIGAGGHVVAVVFEPSDGWHATLPLWGWRGEPVFQLGPRAQKALASAGPVTQRWLERKWNNGDPLRLFVVTHHATLLLNLAPEVGFEMEPDAELADWRGFLN